MIKGTLDSGFEFEYDETIVNDMRFLEEMAEAEKDGYIVPVVEKMLGKEQKEALYKHLEDEKGRVPVQAFMDAFNEIIQKSPNLKN